MTSGQIEIQILAVVVAVACALPGTFLVLRRLQRLHGRPVARLTLLAFLVVVAVFPVVHFA